MQAVVVQEFHDKDDENDQMARSRQICKHKSFHNNNNNTSLTTTIKNKTKLKTEMMDRHQHQRRWSAETSSYPENSQHLTHTSLTIGRQPRCQYRQTHANSAINRKRVRSEQKVRVAQDVLWELCDVTIHRGEAEGRMRQTRGRRRRRRSRREPPPLLISQWGTRMRRGTSSILYGLGNRRN